MQTRIVSAIGFLCLGILVFSLQDLILKSLSGTYPVTQAMAIRSIVALPVLLVLVALGSGIMALRSARTGLLNLRAAISFGAYLCYYMSIAALPLADAVALFFAAPLMIAGMAIVVLGERLDLRTLCALLFGLVGVVVTLRPGAAVFEWAGLLTLLSAALYGVSQIMARKMGDSESAAVMTFYQNLAFLFGAPLLAGVFALGAQVEAPHASLAFLLRPWVWPSPGDFLLMAACGVIAAAGMTLLSHAYRLAPAGNVSVFEYSAIFWAPLWGFLFFAETPKVTTALGAALICGAGVIALYRGNDGVAGRTERSPLLPQRLTFHRLSVRRRTKPEATRQDLWLG